MAALNPAASAGSRMLFGDTAMQCITGKLLGSVSAFWTSYCQMKAAGSIVFLCAFALASCGGKQSQPQQPTAQSTVNYAPKIGIAVSTAARTCMAIQNSTLTPGSQITLVNPAVPQGFMPTQVTGQASEPCPITQETDPSWNNYTLSSSQPNMPKNTPLIAIVGPANNFSLNNTFVNADLDGNQKQDSFRACGASDGVHLSVWQGPSLTGTVLWKGYYYESGNPGSFPTCTPAETPNR